MGSRSGLKCAREALNLSDDGGSPHRVGAAGAEPGKLTLCLAILLMESVLGSHVCSRQDHFEEGQMIQFWLSSCYRPRKKDYFAVWLISVTSH